MSYPQDTPPDTPPDTPRDTPPDRGQPSGTGVDLNDKHPTEKELWELAVTRLREKQDFRGHVVIYLLVNGFLTVIWAMTGAGFFWPIFPILGWGIGLGAHAWNVYGPSVVTHDQIEKEMERLRRR